LISGYEHYQAHIAERVIAVVLFGGLASSWIRPAWTRKAGLVAQAFALFGVLVGIFFIVIGIGQRTVPDICYHIAIVTALVWGLVIAKRASSN
jgi:FtsH-binding integral membrane protein